MQWLCYLPLEILICVRFSLRSTFLFLHKPNELFLQSILGCFVGEICPKFLKLGLKYLINRNFFKVFSLLLLSSLPGFP